MNWNNADVLKSSADVQFKVDAGIARSFGTIGSMLEVSRLDGIDEKIIPVPSVNSASLCRRLTGLLATKTISSVLSPYDVRYLSGCRLSWCWAIEERNQPVKRCLPQLTANRAANFQIPADKEELVDLISMPSNVVIKFTNQIIFNHQGLNTAKYGRKNMRFNLINF